MKFRFPLFFMLFVFFGLNAAMADSSEKNFCHKGIACKVVVHNEYAKKDKVTTLWLSEKDVLWNTDPKANSKLYTFTPKEMPGSEVSLILSDWNIRGDAHPQMKLDYMPPTAHRSESYTAYSNFTPNKGGLVQLHLYNYDKTIMLNFEFACTCANKTATEQDIKDAIEAAGASVQTVH